MIKTLLAAAALVALVSPAVADAAPCRTAKGQFAKCGTPGALSDAQYKAQKGKGDGKGAPAAKPAPKPTPAAKPGACKDAKGKFAKCPGQKK
ncbi:MAG TPA: hypothetical protein VFF98_12895 [Novosphingobium sp.]|nr:hypothetical protein [Novosphingobium sp.]